MQKETISYHFVDPNRPDDVVQALEQMIIEKLLAMQESETFEAPD